MKAILSLLLLLPCVLWAQTEPAPSVNQPSYSLLYYGGLAPASEHASGVAFEAELRRSQRFSWILAAGLDRESTTVSWGTIPIGYPSPNPDDPPLTLPVGFDEVRQSYRRFHVGAGPQYNHRIGNGDLSGSAVLNLGIGQLVQRVTYEGQRLIESYTNNEPDPTPILYRQLKQNRIRYYNLVQPGLRLQLHYTWWFDPQYAIRVGGYGLGFGGLVLNKYERGNPARHREREVVGDPATRLYSNADGFPDRSYFRSRSPEAIQFRAGLSIGMVYKPLNK